jgi:prolipoprotein diacylglyceryltransferase
MWPTLISLGPIAIHSFGVLLFVGIFFGGFRLWKNAKEEGWDEADVMDSWLLGGLGAIVGGRAMFILTHWSEFANSWYKMLFITRFPGLDYEGAWLFGLFALLILSLRKKFSFWHWFEAAIMAILIVEIFGHLASFFSASNLGRPTDGWWGVAFPGFLEKRWPVQLFWTLGLTAIYQILKLWEHQYRSFKWYQNDKGEAKEGFVAAAYLIFVGILKLALVPISATSRVWWAAAMIVAGALILVIRSGINIRVKLPKGRPPKAAKIEIKRKKKGFDYV